MKKYYAAYDGWTKAFIKKVDEKGKELEASEFPGTIFKRITRAQFLGVPRRRQGLPNLSSTIAALHSTLVPLPGCGR